MRKNAKSAKEGLSCLEISFQYESQNEQTEISKIICEKKTDNNFVFIINSLPYLFLADTYDTLFCAGALSPTHLSYDSFESLAAITKPGIFAGNYVNCGKVSISLWQLYFFCCFYSPLSSIFF